MKRNLTIFSQVFLICTLFTNAWGLTNYERCVEAYLDKDFTNAYHFCKEDKDANAQFMRLILRCFLSRFQMVSFTIHGFLIPTLCR